MEEITWKEAIELSEKNFLEIEEGRTRVVEREAGLYDRVRTIDIEAVQFTGSNLDEIKEFVGPERVGGFTRIKGTEKRVTHTLKCDIGPFGRDSFYESDWIVRTPFGFLVVKDSAYRD